MANHDCIISGCTGKDLLGISLTCQSCLKPCFLDCIKFRKEIIELSTAFELNNLLKPTQITAQQQVVNKIKSMFAQNSVFVFICVACKNKGVQFESRLNQNQEATLMELQSKIQLKEGELVDMKKRFNDVSLQ